MPILELRDWVPWNWDYSLRRFSCVTVAGLGFLLALKRFDCVLKTDCCTWDGEADFFAFFSAMRACRGTFLFDVRMLAPLFANRWRWSGFYTLRPAVRAECFLFGEITWVRF